MNKYRMYTAIYKGDSKAYCHWANTEVETPLHIKSFCDDQMEAALACCMTGERIAVSIFYDDKFYLSFEVNKYAPLAPIEPAHWE